VQDIIGLQCGVRAARSLDLLVIPGRGPFFFAGTRGSGDTRRAGRMGAGAQLTAQDLAETALVAADAAGRWRLTPG